MESTKTDNGDFLFSFNKTQKLRKWSRMVRCKEGDIDDDEKYPADASEDFTENEGKAAFHDD